MTEIGLREARAQLGPLANRAELAREITYLTRNGRRVAAIVPLDRIKETTMQTTTATTYYVMNSNGSEDVTADRAWIVVDGEDAMLASAPYEDDDEIADGIRRLVETGALPAGAKVVEETRLYAPYPWQIDSYRWTLMSRSAESDDPGFEVGDRVRVPEYSVPDDWAQTGEVVEVLPETVVVELDGGHRQELPHDDVTRA